MRDSHCVITRRPLQVCHGAHIYPYSLGKTQQKSTLDLWKVLEMFWGKERKEKLQQLIFGNTGTTLPASKTLINSLYNMLTLSADTHSYWALGTFILEPLEEQSDSHELRARVRYMPQHFENPKELEIDVDPANIEIMPLEDSDCLIDYVTMSPIMKEHIITLKTSDPVNAPLPNWDLLMLQCLLIRVSRMAGRVGQDMLETFDSDNDISSLAASDGVSPEKYVDNNLQNPSLAGSFRSPKPSGHVNLTPKQPATKHPSTTKKVVSYLRRIFDTHTTRFNNRQPDLLAKKRSTCFKRIKALGRTKQLPS